MKSPLKIKNPPARPLVIFDGDCGFCRFWVLRWQSWTGGAVDYEPLQSAAMREHFPELPRASLEDSLHLVMQDGTVFWGAEAVFRALGGREFGCALICFYEDVPGFAPVSEAAYRFVAGHRPFFSWMTRVFWGPSSGPPRFDVSTRWFLRALALIYIVAFWSLGLQIKGLIGAHGLEPVPDLMQAARHELGGTSLRNLHLLPTLCWWNESDGFLKFQCAAGISLGCVLLLGLFQGPALLLLWALYLSLTTVSGDFLGFQWDSLLLESGFLAVWLAPWRPWVRWKEPCQPSRLARWLFWWLLFRLMFLSGCVKLLSGDEAWRNLTALTYHYQTQPLPTFLAWYAHHLPVSVQKLSTLGMFFIELAAPFAIVLPRRARHAAGMAFILLELVIMLTGNYTFFNFLSMALALLLFDDAFFGRPAPSGVGVEKGKPVWPSRVRLVTLVPLAFVIALVTLWELVGTFGRPGSSIPWAQSAAVWISPFRSINSYGLFAVMTKTRDEIVIEGSADGAVWREYVFPDKPGEMKRRPRFVAPYQPRLDWQMWFAALGTSGQNPWFAPLMIRLLQGTPEVLSLFKKNPFPDQPPRFIRARLYNYRFTTSAERAAGEGWWHREYKGTYFPLLSLSMVSGKPG